MKRLAVAVTMLVLSGCTQPGRIAQPTPSVSPQPSATQAIPAPAIDDISFIDTARGWLVRHDCTGDCSSDVLATTDGGRHWRRNGTIAFNATAQHNVMFTDEANGYAWDPELAVTPDGGRTWAANVPFDGKRRADRVVSVEAVGPSIWALGVTTCPQPGTKTCAARIFTSKNNGPWTSMVPPGGIVGPQAQLLRASSARAWVLSWGDVKTPRDKALLLTNDGGHSWKALENPCAGTAYSAAERVAAPGKQLLWLFCAKKEGAGPQKKLLFTSSDAGLHWHLPLIVPALGVLGYDAVIDDQLAFLSLPGGGVWRTTDGSHAWRTVLRKDDDSQWGSIEFVDVRHGWVVHGNTLYATSDGGRRWRGTLVPR
ncbi:MAG: hypothetical protein LC750_16265 [Actinobacteria bacterium]|nr:hypothetical protein [Actinomycetota bacterium]